MEADIDVAEDDGKVCGYGGWQRGFCMSDNAVLSGCSWYGTPKKCNILCPAGYLALAYNSQPQNERVACQSGGYAVYCCQSVWASPVVTCGEPVFGLTIHKILAGGSVGTVDNSAINVKGYPSWPGSIGISPWQCLTPYNTQLDVSMYDAPGDIGGYFIADGELDQSEVPDPGGLTSFKPVISSTDTSSTTVYSTKTVTCSGASYGQACQHYRSVIQTHPEMDFLTCPPSAGAGGPEVTAYNKQHTNAWITNWVKPFTKTLSLGAGQYDSCQRDKYPPFVFYQGLPSA
jgi:hypothetical protein